MAILCSFPRVRLDNVGRLEFLTARFQSQKFDFQLLSLKLSLDFTLLAPPIEGGRVDS